MKMRNYFVSREADSVWRAAYSEYRMTQIFLEGKRVDKGRDREYICMERGKQKEFISDSAYGGQV